MQAEEVEVQMINSQLVVQEEQEVMEEVEKEELLQDFQDQEHLKLQE